MGEQEETGETRVPFCRYVRSGQFVWNINTIKNAKVKTSPTFMLQDKTEASWPQRMLDSEYKGRSKACRAEVSHLPLYLSSLLSILKFCSWGVWGDPYVQCVCGGGGE